MRTGKKPISAANALNRAAALCSRSEQASADIVKKLRDWGLAEADVAAVMERLVKEKFVDDGRYAVAFVRDKFRFGGWGKMKIAYALRQKHIAEANIAEALEEIGEEEYGEALLAALRTKMHSVKGRQPMQQRAALYRFAASRGYESSMISRAISTLLSDSSDDDSW